MTRRCELRFIIKKSKSSNIPESASLIVRSELLKKGSNKDTLALIDSIQSSLHDRIRKLKIEEAKQEKKIRREEAIRKKTEKEERVFQEMLKSIHDKQRKKLFNYFNKHNSSIALPKWAIDYDNKVIDSAKEEYSDFVSEKMRKDELLKEVTDFVNKHNAYPLNFNNLNLEEKKLYQKILRKSKKGKLENVKIDANAEHPTLKKLFYHTKELNLQERKELKKIGYRDKSFIQRIGKPGNNLIIKHNTKSESDYHFCMKNLYAEIKGAKMEYRIDGKEADVAFIFDDAKIAVEIETGTNNESHLENKVSWLNKNFDYWIFICGSKRVNRYKKYIDNKKSFCFATKEAQEKLLQILGKYGLY